MRYSSSYDVIDLTLVPKFFFVPKVIENGILESPKKVVDNYSRIKKLETGNLDFRSWLLDVLSCINDIKTNEFTLQDMYLYVDLLQKLHINNHNIKAKIRQQLQFLRDKGFIEFLGRGHYKKLEEHFNE